MSLRLIYLLLIPVPLFLPYLWLNHYFFWSSTDSIFYLNVYKAYRNALWQGDFFPHWSRDFDVGLGNIILYGRSPVSYSLTALVNAPFRFSDETQFLWGMYCSQLFGAWSMWFWLRGKYEPKLAMIAALLFTLLPYKFFMIYIHFNLAQCWAMAFVPLWFYAGERITTRNGVFLYGIMGALCFHAHMLTWISAVVVVFFYAFYFHYWQLRRIFISACLAHALMLMLCAGYFSAIITSLPWMQLNVWGQGEYNSLKNLDHADDYFCFYMPLIACMYYGYRKTLPQPVGYFWLGALIALYVFATPLSYPIWANVSFLNIFQFPFDRLQPCMQLATAMLCVKIFSAQTRVNSIRLIVILSLFTLWLGLHIQAMYSFNQRKEITPTIQSLALQYSIFPNNMSGEFTFPKWSQLKQNEIAQNYKTYLNMPRIKVTQGKAEAKLLGESNGKMSMSADVKSKQATVTFAQLYVPAWQATSDGSALEVKPSAGNGLVEIILPKGKHEVEVAITKSSLERLGDAMTNVALIACFMHYAAMILGRNKAKTA